MRGNLQASGGGPLPSLHDINPKQLFSSFFCRSPQEVREEELERKNSKKFGRKAKKSKLDLPHPLIFSLNETHAFSLCKRKPHHRTEICISIVPHYSPPSFVGLCRLSSTPTPATTMMMASPEHRHLNWQSLLFLQVALRTFRRRCQRSFTTCTL